jgi:alanine racemase
LSVINEKHNLGFEAGISTVSEMAKLEYIIKPTIGVLTSIGSSHDEGFESTEQKIKENCFFLRIVKFLFIRKIS